MENLSVKTLLTLYERKLSLTQSQIENAQAETESVPAESEEEADYLFERAEKILLKLRQKEEDLKEFISELKIYM